MSQQTILKINGDRLVERLKCLGQVGALDGGGVSRLALTTADREGRDLVVSWMKQLGMTVSIDQIGNIIATRQGADQNAAPVMTGSHIDTVRTGGLYDGNLGVLAGLEVVERLNELDIKTRHPIAVAVFTNEEGARFSPDMMGSFVYVGGMPLAEALDTVGIDGKTVRECLNEIGYAGTSKISTPSVHAFLELHIEQGPVLDEEQVQIGVVEEVQGISWTEYTFEGVSNHAGTTPMRLRKDAGFAAMSVANHVREVAIKMGGNQVGTVGFIEIKPNLVNVVPNFARITVDLRNTDEKLLQLAESNLTDFIDSICSKEKLKVSSKTLARFEPVNFDPSLVDRVEQTAKSFGYSSMRIPSGAGHDAQMLARICPSAMIFVPSKKGISHNIKEFTAPEDLCRGADILLSLMLDLAIHERSDML